MKCNEDDLRFQLIFAMWLLGPPDWPPPRHVYEALRRAVRVHVPAGKVQERVLDAVIAFQPLAPSEVEKIASSTLKTANGRVAVSQTLPPSSLTILSSYKLRPKSKGIIVD